MQCDAISLKEKDALRIEAPLRRTVATLRRCDGNPETALTTA